MSLTTHKNRYKNTALDSQELRRRREEEGVQLRKQKREQQLFKRRNVNVPVFPEDDGSMQVNRSLLFNDETFYIKLKIACYTIYLKLNFRRKKLPMEASQWTWLMEFIVHHLKYS
jgi:hypothetical protein